MILGLLSLSLGLTAITILISFLVAEKYFFDKFFYKKSARYGYGELQSPGLQKRLHDVRLLLEAEKNDQPIKKTPGEFTVVLIGDSMVYGEGVLLEHRFGNVLEKKLNKYFPSKVYVLAQPGDHLLDNYAKFLLAKKYIDPDVYVIGLINNDLLIDHRDRYPGTEQIYAELRSICTQKEFLQLPDYTLPWSEVVMGLYRHTFDEGSANRCYLDVLSRRFEEEKDIIALSFFDDPLPEDIPADREEWKKEEAVQMFTYQQAFIKAGATVLFPLQMSGFSYQPASLKEGHPSQETHRKYSKLLFGELEKYW